MGGKSVAVIGTLDTKGPEYDFLRAELSRHGLATVMVDISCRRVPEEASPDYPCTEVARRGGREFSRVSQLNRIEAGKVMVRGATAILQELYHQGRVDGLIALGGSNGSAMACQIMQAFPIGLPKLVVSVMAAGDPRQNAGIRDIALMNSVTDMCLNRITKQVIANAAAAMAGMLQHKSSETTRQDKLQVGVSMLGLTQECVLGVKARLEAMGCEVLPFHANGIGGAALENLIAQGAIDAVLDLTTNEVANNLLGGVFDAGPNRLEAAAARGIPQVIAPGAVDFVNFWGQHVPEQYRNRQFILHSVQNTLMRTNPEENARLGALFAEKLNRNTGRAVVLVPLRGFSGNDRAGGPHAVTAEGAAGAPWHDPEATRAFLHALKAAADPEVIEIREVDAHINSPSFVEAVVEAFDEVATT